MDELKQLIELIKSLPDMAMWIAAAILLYKVVVVGSIYGVIKFCVSKFVEWRMKPIDVSLDGVAVNASAKLSLIAQIDRIKRADLGIRYIHMTDVDWLRDAIDLKKYIEENKQSELAQMVKKLNGNYNIRD